MNWYKFAKIQKEALNMNDLYDFYLIASISKEHFKYLFESDPEKKYYFAQKLDDIKNEYIIGGIFALNLELRYAEIQGVRDIFIKNPKDILEKSKFFTDKTPNLWPSAFYGGESWAKIADLIYDLSQFPDLMDYIVEGAGNEFLVNQIYLLILKIDHINDVCHNTGIALPKMMNEYYKSIVKEADDLVQIKNRQEYSKVKYDIHERVTSFLDFKKEHDIRNILLRKNIDKELLESLEREKSQLNVDITSLPYIFRLIKKYGYEKLNIKKKEIYSTFIQSIMVGYYNNSIIAVINMMSEEELKEIFSFLIKTIKESFYADQTILTKLFNVRQEIKSTNKINVLNSAILRIFKILIDNTKSLSEISSLMREKPHLIDKFLGNNKYNEIVNYLLNKVKILTKSKEESLDGFLASMEVSRQISRLIPGLSELEEKRAKEILDTYLEKISHELQSCSFFTKLFFDNLFYKIDSIISAIGYQENKENFEKIFEILISKFANYINSDISMGEYYFNSELQLETFISYLNDIITYDNKNKKMAKEGLLLIEDKLIDYCKTILIKELKYMPDMPIDSLYSQINRVSNVFFHVEIISPQIKNKIFKKAKQRIQGIED